MLVADSSRTEYHYLPAIWRALEHCGLPFRLLDLAWDRLDRDQLDRCAGMLFAQEHIADSLDGAQMSAVLDAVADGVGLVNLDFDLRGPLGRLAAALRLDAGRHEFAALDAIGIRTDQHYVTATRESGEQVRTRRPLAYLRVSAAPDRVLAEADAGGPVLLAASVGRGRVAQWLLSPRVWLRQYLGWTRGLDDLFWKSIVWTARKPLLMKPMPPFVRMRFDDCLGYWRDAADFAFLDPFIARGHRPNVSLNVRAVTPDGARHIAELAGSGRADFAAHTLDADTSAWFKRGHGPYSPAEMRAIGDEVDAAFRSWRVTPSRVLSDHEHEFGHTALPYLRARGIRFKMNINLPDEAAEGRHRDWQPAPYGSMSYAFDTQPVSGMFVAFNHFPSFDDNRTYLEDGRHFYLNRTGGVGECKWDFLNGLTESTSGRNDLETAAQRLARHTRRGLDSLFFGGSISHSHFLRDLRPAEWDQLLDRTNSLLRRYSPRYVSYDHIAAYADSKVSTSFASVDAQPDGSVAFALAGTAAVPLEVCCVRESGEDAVQTWHPVPTFTGRLESNVPASD